MILRVTLINIGPLRGVEVKKVARRLAIPGMDRDGVKVGRARLWQEKDILLNEPVETQQIVAIVNAR